MTETKPKVAVVDDDEAVRDALMMLLEADGLPVLAFASGGEFLDALHAEHIACVIADVRMPGITGIELMERLRATNAALPVILITGHGDIPMAVAALKAGAADFFEKPFDENLLLASVHDALDTGDAQRRRQSAFADLQVRAATLTPREREVMDLIVEGHPNKVAAARLAISPRTVEIHRSRVMEKMQARNLSDLVRMSLRLSGDGR